MDALDAISRRRSIRRFKEDRIPRELLEKLLAVSVLSPSANNRQPWRFVVLEGQARLTLSRLMVQGAEFLKSRGEDTGSCLNSARIVAQAPATIVVFNAAYEHDDLIFENPPYNSPDIMSIGAMIQTMLLAAESLGLGSLWIADVLYAYPLIREWLSRRQELIAAVSLGYPDESPAARSRVPFSEVTVWRETE